VSRRRARIRTTHASPEAAAVVAGAVEPDNTASMTTDVDGARVVTTVVRETTGGLASSVDDFVVNLAVADRLAGAGADPDPDPDATGKADGGVPDDPKTTAEAPGATETAEATETTETTDVPNEPTNGSEPVTGPATGTEPTTDPTDTTRDTDPDTNTETETETNE
jgi:hypothetical protein